MHFIAKLFPEITIKSSPVRKRLTRQLRDNLRRLLRPLDGRIDVQRDWEKLDLVVPDDRPELAEAVAAVLAATPGIAKFSRVDACPLVSIDDICERVVASWGERLAGKTLDRKSVGRGRVWGCEGVWS